jgi:hypothetical protein
MGRAGRKRKPGKRTASGRLSREGICAYDKGTEHTQAMQSLYGPDGADAIGRAYRAGLLGDLRTEGAEAKALLDTARRISNAYWQAYSHGGYSCALGERSFGSVIVLDVERVKRREEWLNGCLDTVARLNSRRVFDQLVIDVNPDSGPDWLDRLCYASQLKRDALPADSKALAKAIYALAQLVA